MLPDFRKIFKSTRAQGNIVSLGKHWVELRRYVFSAELLRAFKMLKCTAHFYGGYMSADLLNSCQQQEPGHFHLFSGLRFGATMES